ncbi:MAG: hypothetical protein IKY18_00015 [Oscillospiraceae bacterium]|nr:hypothetical protein [Oscillospiraceae bacterium]
MKIFFESPDEIQQIASIISNHIFPNPLVFDAKDLAAACSSDDLDLPWQDDGFHIPVTVKHNRWNKPPKKVVARVRKKQDIVSCSTTLCLHDCK